MEAEIVDVSKGERTARRICDAAIEAFARSGYAAVSMREIASTAGIAPGAIYNHFPSKQEILRSVLATHMEQLLTEATCLIDAEDAPMRLAQFVRFHIQYHHDKTREVFLSYMELRNLDEENYREISVYRDEYEALLHLILLAGQEEGSFIIDDTQITTKAIIGMLASLSNWYQSEGRLGLDALVEIYGKLIARMVGLEILEGR